MTCPLAPHPPAPPNRLFGPFRSLWTLGARDRSKNRADMAVLPASFNSHPSDTAPAPVPYEMRHTLELAGDRLPRQFEAVRRRTSHPSLCTPVRWRPPMYLHRGGYLLSPERLRSHRVALAMARGYWHPEALAALVGVAIRSLPEHQVLVEGHPYACLYPNMSRALLPSRQRVVFARCDICAPRVAPSPSSLNLRCMLIVWLPNLLAFRARGAPRARSAYTPILR
ncbi:hypothetical protein B0H16DRAFT_1729092 [Mycena metata]|uniref:Uncharacterized protein n=1 Tax=Mycena metata TaxID=1033252 RepID=A0AAD7IEW9_9AGAR|nr:hypothetical protein B0H16DRAFT_1729092 [Mycena metata]